MHQLGSGVLGPVYRARPSRRGPAGDDRPVALKVFQIDLAPEQTIVFGEALQRIVDVGVPHPAVAAPVGAGVADGMPYLAYEYVAGHSLDAGLRSRAPMAAEAALTCIVQIAEALDAAHGRDLVHGALHLRDVLVAPGGACVVGFGVVAALDRVGRRGPLRPPYAAPEQIAGGGWGAAADRYALAAVAWELLTGRRAAPAPAAGRTAGRLEPVLGAEAAGRLTPVFDAALAADPDRRPRSAGRLADDLAGALAWTGAAAARRAGGGSGGAGTRESGVGWRPERVEGDPAIAAGGAAPPVGGPVAAAVGGTVMRKRGKRMPGRRQQAEVDWTKQALDLNPPDGRSGTEAGDPRADDAAAGEAALDAGGAGVDAIDEALRGRAAVGDGPDAGGDIELRTGADPLADVAEGLHAGLRDGRGGAVADADLEEAGLAPEPPATDGYAPISVGELESRVEGGAEGRSLDGEPLEAASEPGYGAAGGGGAGGEEAAPDGPVEPASEAADDGVVDGGEDGDEFALTPEESYDYGPEDESEPDDPAAEIFGGGSGEPANRLPVALVAVIGVAVAVTAFVIGLGWMGGDGGDTAGAGEAPPAVSDDPGGGFSEGVVGGAAPEPAAAGAGDDAAPVAATSPGGEPAGPGGASGTARDTAPAVPSPVRRPAPVPAPRPPVPPPPPASAPAPTPADGRLLVRSTPPGAEVIVNGEPRGTTPLALAALPHGPYEVEVTLAGYGSRRTQIVLDAGDPIGAWHADLTAVPTVAAAAGAVPARAPAAAQVAVGSIRAETRPPGAEVWLDERLVGETPASIPDVPAGAHRIEFRLDGYRPWTTTVEVAPETQARVAASLADAAR